MLLENMWKKLDIESSFEIIQNILPFEEYFTGSNLKSYKHKYYLAYIKDKNLLNNKYQKVKLVKLDGVYMKNV